MNNLENSSEEKKILKEELKKQIDSIPPEMMVYNLNDRLLNDLNLETENGFVDENIEDIKAAIEEIILIKRRKNIGSSQRN